MNSQVATSDLDAARKPALLAAVCLCAGAVLGLALLAAAVLDLGGAYAVKALASYGLGALFVVFCARRYFGARSFGIANGVTLLRWALTALLIAQYAEPRTTPLLWSAVVIAVLALVLDGVDGSVARRRGEVSAFGARFDMETDAALILVLSVLVWHFDRAGAWIVLGGLWRYLFVLGGAALPWLQRPLPASRRRQTLCVVQVITLVVCLAPIVPAALSPLIGALGLASLSASFLIDIVWLARQRNAGAGLQNA